MTEPVIISVGGGKGGVGKSVITANLGAMLARRGFRVGFIDGDLRGANLHLALGVRRPARGLRDFIDGHAASLGEAAVPTLVPNSWLIAGASDILQLANPKYAQKQKLISHIGKMDADYIFVDLGAGTDANVCDFFAAFPYGIVVSDGLPTSIENAYGFIKNGILRGLIRLFPGNREVRSAVVELSAGGCDSITTITELFDRLTPRFPEETDRMRSWLKKRRIMLVLNMVRDEADIVVGERFKRVVARYLSVDLIYAGYVIFSHSIRASIRALIPAVLNKPEQHVLDCFTAIAGNVAHLTTR